MITRRTGSIVALIATAVLLSACGSEQAANTTSNSNVGHNRPEPAKYTQAQVYSALGVTDQGTSADDGECVASVVMLTPAEIKTYADAGDPVATNSTGTIGVKVGTYQGVSSTMCFDRFTTALAKLR